MTVPLIYTSKGNLPIEDLRYETAWEDAPTFIKLIERYWLGEEVVRESAHVYAKQGLFSEAMASTL